MVITDSQLHRLAFLHIYSVSIRRLTSQASTSGGSSSSQYGCKKHLSFLVRPKTIVFGRTYVLLQMFIIFFFQREISEMRGPTGMKFCTMISTRPYFVMPVQNFGGHTPKNFGGKKLAKFGPISDDFEVRRRISPERMKIFKIG